MKKSLAFFAAALIVVAGTRWQHSRSSTSMALSPVEKQSLRDAPNDSSQAPKVDLQKLGLDPANAAPVAAPAAASAAASAAGNASATGKHKRAKKVTTLQDVSNTSAKQSAGSDPSLRVRVGVSDPDSDWDPKLQGGVFGGKLFATHKGTLSSGDSVVFTFKSEYSCNCQRLDLDSDDTCDDCVSVDHVEVGLNGGNLVLKSQDSLKISPNTVDLTAPFDHKETVINVDDGATPFTFKLTIMKLSAAPAEGSPADPNSPAACSYNPGE